MRALQFQASQTMALADLPTPEIGPGEVLCDVVVAGICGTDLKIARGEHRLFPQGTERVPGHELVGRVRENRSDDPGLAPGTLVVVAPNMACGKCVACSVGRGNVCLNYESIGLTVDGAFAETVRIPRRAVEQGNLIPVPDGLEPEVAVLMEPLAAVLHGLRALDVAADDSVLVFGAGPIGLLAVVLARQLGAGKILVSQTSAGRRELALRFGADVAIDPRAEDLLQRVRDETGERGADAVVVATPAHAVYPQALEAAAIGGRINYFAGLPSSDSVVGLDANLVHYRELRVTGTTANSTQDCLDALDILANHPEDYRRFVTHRFALADIEEAFRVSAEGAALKAVVVS
jgi:L-iditol 2-dehydrogenase